MAERGVAFRCSGVATFLSTLVLGTVEILTRAGLPDGLCNVLTGTGTGVDVGAPLAAHPGVSRPRTVRRRTPSGNPA